MCTYLIDDFEVHVTAGPGRLFDEIQRRMHDKVILPCHSIGLSRRTALLKFSFEQRLIATNDDKEKRLLSRHCKNDREVMGTATSILRNMHDTGMSIECLLYCMIWHDNEGAHGGARPAGVRSAVEVTTLTLEHV